MQHIFSPTGQARLADTMRAKPLLVFDFDGTLAPIVARPDYARVTPGVATRLAALAQRLPLAIVSGREAADVRRRLHFSPRYVVGSHGADSPIWPDERPWTSALEPARAWLASHRDALDELGVRIEDKRFSVALHYRLAPDRALAQRRLRQLLATLPDGLQVFGGKQVFNIVADSAPDKADAVKALARHAGCTTVFFVGDDVNDEPVFAEAAAHWLTIKVGRDSPPSQARFFLDSSAEMALLLERMLRLLDAQNIACADSSR